MQIVECSSQAVYDNFLLLKQLYPDLTEESYSQRIMQLTAIGYRQAGIVDEGKCIAVTGFHRAVHLSSGPYLYVDDLVVDAAYRARHYGKMLLRWLEEEAGRLGCSYIFLDAFVENKPAHKLYHSERFAIAAFHFIKSLS